MGLKTAAPAVLIFVVALSFMGAACAPPSSPTPVPGPAGTYRLSGSVIDATSAAPVQGAVVEARIAADGSMPIAATAAGPDGKYSLPGVPGVTYVRVIQYGYFDVNERVELTADGTRNFTFAPDPSAPDLNGSYTLTIETDDACPSAPSPVPPQLRRRTLPARIEHVGSRLTVRVSPDEHTEQPSDFAGCVYRENGKCDFAGQLSAGGATFWLTKSGPDWESASLPDLLESIQIDNPPPPLVELQELWFIGTATTNFSANGLLGNLDGTIDYYPIGFRGIPAVRRAPSVFGARTSERSNRLE